LQQLQSMAANMGNFTSQVSQMTSATNTFEAKLGKRMNAYTQLMQEEANHDYSAIANRYNGKLQKLYDDVCNTNESAQVDALYDQADQLLYDYRLEAAREYRASLQRRISEVKKMMTEIEAMMQEMVASGELPECAVGRLDMNCVIEVANLLDEAYKELPELEAKPVCMATIYELKEGWEFCGWECRGYVGGGVSDFSASNVSWPLLAQYTDDQTGSQYGVVERGNFRTISESELQSINKQADQRMKQQGGPQKPPYGTYKSRNGKRTVEYSQTGELIINGMTTFAPAAFAASTDVLEWIVFQGNKIVKCTYKL